MRDETMSIENEINMISESHGFSRFSCNGRRFTVEFSINGWILRENGIRVRKFIDYEDALIFAKLIAGVNG